MVIARALYERYPKEPEGQLSRRYNALVARETCAEIGRDFGIPALSGWASRRARTARARATMVVGDVVESLIGALSSTAASRLRSASSARPGSLSRPARAAPRSTQSPRSGAGSSARPQAAGL